MKYLIILFGLTAGLFAFSDSLQSFSADFEQNITDEHNKTITYSGHVWAQRPDMALWSYQKPVEKHVYVNARNVTVLEPDLEQAIVKKIANDIDLFAIVTDAKPVGDGRYEALYESQAFTITLREGVIDKIEYKDPFENLVTLQFSAQEQNKEIAEERFRVKIPADYDIIRD